MLSSSAVLAQCVSPFCQSKWSCRSAVSAGLDYADALWLTMPHCCAGCDNFHFSQRLVSGPRGWSEIRTHSFETRAKPMSDSHIAHATQTAPITMRGVACFMIQLALNMSLISVTALACVLWCVPSSLLLGIVASVEATIRHTRAKRSRARVQHSPTPVHSATNTDYFATTFGQVCCASQIYGLGAPAA